MPAFTSIVANDRAATPVAHTFAPRARTPIPTLGEAALIPSGERRVTIGERKSGTGAGQKIRTTIRFANPKIVTETINGVSVPKVSNTQYVEATFTFTGDSLLQERKDTVTMFLNLFAAGGMIDTMLVTPESLT